MTKTHKNRILRVAKAIRREGQFAKRIPVPDFNMENFVSDGYGNHPATAKPNSISCNTVCCIAGMACFLYPRIANGNNYEISAAKILGLTEKQADFLFYGGFKHAGFFSEITREEAAQALERLAETGEVS